MADSPGDLAGPPSSGGVDVVVVGQIPPPTHGQAIMVEAVMRMDRPGLRLHLVRLNFSNSFAEIGRIRPRKLLELVSVVRAIRRVRRETAATVLYMVIGGDGVVPLIRDTLLLASVNRGFDRVVLHVHGVGVGARLEALPRPVRVLALRLRGRPDVVVQSSLFSPADGAALLAHSVVTVPNGLPRTLRNVSPMPGPVRLLYLGTLREIKGILILLDALGRLRAGGVDARLTLGGKPLDAAFGAQLQAALDRHALGDAVMLPGQLDGEAKSAALGAHDIFVFPSFYEGENQSVAMGEAVGASLPIVAANWRGAGGLVEDGVTGLLVEPRSAEAFAEALRQLCTDRPLRQRMSAAAGERFEREYTEEVFHNRIAEVLRAVPAIGRGVR